MKNRILALFYIFQCYILKLEVLNLQARKENNDLLIQSIFHFLLSDNSLQCRYHNLYYNVHACSLYNVYAE